MFQAAKNNLLRQTNSSAHLLVKQPARHFQQFSRNYMTGFDRMLLDKLRFFRISGWWFALFGLANVGAYAASLYMRPDNFQYHFGYRGEGSSLFTFFKSQFGSDRLANVSWTAPALIGLNWYLHSKVGPLVLSKLFFLSLFSSYIFLSALNGNKNLRLGLQKWFKWDCYAEDGSYTMGADQMAQSLFYFTLLYHGLWLPALGLTAFDALYYGPSTLGGPFAAFASALMFL